MKSITPLTIDEEIKREAKAKNLNMSAVAEDAIREALGKVEVEINQKINNCEFCGREGQKETAEDIKRLGHYSRPNALTWLYPDEKWICNHCLRKLSQNITK